MILNRQHITDYIRCPYLFGKSVLSNKSKSARLPAKYNEFRDFIISIAAQEMKNMEKLSLSEYRIRYTNKFYTTAKQVLNIDGSLIQKLNSQLSVFADNIFCAYNIPIDIAVPGTSVVFRDVVSFGMTTPDKDMIFIEIDDLTNTAQYNQIIRNWVQYYIVYSYLAKIFDKRIEVIIFDPILDKKINLVYLPNRYDDDLITLSEMVKPIYAGNMYKNLFACETCNLIGEC